MFYFGFKESGSDKCPEQFSIWPVNDSKISFWTSEFKQTNWFSYLIDTGQKNWHKRLTIWPQKKARFNKTGF